jgi:hypothetical protein
MANKCKNTNPLKRDGASQISRILAELQPSFAKIFEWKHSDWCKFVYQFADLVRYYKTDNPDIPAGKWTVFYEQFSTEAGINEFLDELGKANDAHAHIALLMAFIHLLDLVKNHINELTGRHLDFYYKSVLQLKNKPFTPDKAHIVFEAVKNAGKVKLEAGSILKADKDPDGNQKYYQTNEELIVNEVKVSELKSIFHNRGSLPSYDEEGLFYADKTNTQDGLEPPLEEDAAWNPFASKSWPKATIGFSLASSILNLKEGDRSIFFKIKLKSSISGSWDNYEKALIVSFSGHEGWLGPYPLTNISNNSTEKALLIQVDVPASEESIVPFSSDVFEESIRTDLPVARFQFNVNAQEEAERSIASSMLKRLHGVEILSMEIGVDVRGMKENILENDFGPLEPSKPFMPFGSQPTAGNNLFIGNREIFDKEWKNLSIDISWKDLPLNDDGVPDLRTHYYAYRKKFARQNSKNKYDVSENSDGSVPEVEDDELLISGNDSILSDVYILASKSWNLAVSSKPLITPYAQDETTGVIKSQYNITNDSASEDCGFLPTMPEIEAETEEESSKKGNIGLEVLPGTSYSSVFSESITFNFLAGNHLYYDVGAFDFSSAKPIQQVETFGASAKKGFIKIALKGSFYHKLYPVLYALAMTAEKSDDLILPNEPYTPFVEALTLNYQACTSEDFGISSREEQLVNFSKKNIQLFHEGPFGFAQQHNFLKHSLSFLSAVGRKKIYLEPFYPYNGEFFIGFDNAAPQQTIALLMQFAAGSEDPLAIFDSDTKIRFWILASNEWRELETSHILKNTTNGFLQPGIFKFIVPKEATSNNSLMPSGLIWFRVTMPSASSPDAICKLLGIFPQAVTAQFDNRGNNLAHLESSLPAEAISKMIGRPAGIKSILQPYNSFDGKPAEKSGDFYKRVSERLRHKQRAVSIWDYEILTLESFPEIHKAKCLNHTFVDMESNPMKINELAPGFVTLVLIPDLYNKNAFDPLQPRVSRNTLKKVEDFLVPLCSGQVHLEVINPLYEQVELTFKVLFHDGYDPSYYETQLNVDLVAYLSPWMSERNKKIEFGTYLYESTVIHFIDSLEYVDMIKDFSMKHYFIENGIDREEKKKKIAPSNSAAILVSKSKHNIEVLDKALICLDE